MAGKWVRYTGKNKNEKEGFVACYRVQIADILIARGSVEEIVGPDAVTTAAAIDENRTVEAGARRGRKPKVEAAE